MKELSASARCETLSIKCPKDWLYGTTHEVLFYSVSQRLPIDIQGLADRFYCRVYILVRVGKKLTTREGAIKPRLMISCKNKVRKA